MLTAVKKSLVCKKVVLSQEEGVPLDQQEISQQIPDRAGAGGMTSKCWIESKARVLPGRNSSLSNAILWK